MAAAPIVKAPVGGGLHRLDGIGMIALNSQ